MGLGLAKSSDGLNWECLPPIRVTGVADQKAGNAGPAYKAVETSGVAKLGDRYFILGGNPAANADIILASDQLEGPYQPAPKNAILMRGPQIFQRIYDLPGGYLSMPMLWVNRGRRSYEVAPFRTLATDGESLWFKWWEGNEKLKVHSLPATLEESGAADAPRMIGEAFDLSKGLVLEAEIRVSVPGRDVNWAVGAEADASAVETRDWWPDGHFAADKAVDGRPTTAWRTPTAKFGAPVDPTLGNLAVLTIDLGQSRAIGSLRIDRLFGVAHAIVQASLNGKDWMTLGELPSSKNASLENLDTEARFVRIQHPQGRRGVTISEIVVSPDPFFRVPEGAGGLFVEGNKGTGWAWFVDRGGRIRFGEVIDGGRRFRQLKERDLEIELSEIARLRLVQRNDIVDLYVNDYQVDYYQLAGGTPSGRIGLFSPETRPAPQAWRPDPNYSDVTKVAE